MSSNMDKYYVLCGYELIPKVLPFIERTEDIEVAKSFLRKLALCLM